MRKIISIVLVAVALISLSSCSSAIAEMRDAQVKSNADMSVLTYRGEEYVRLEGVTHLPLNFSFEYAYLTDEDVPVLLSQFVGNEILSYKGDLLLIGDYYDVYYGNSMTYYCRADVYDEIAARIAAEDYFGTYSFTYWTVDYDLTEHIFTNKEAEMFAAAVASGEQTVFFDGLKQCYLTEIYVCDDEGFFSQYYADLYRTDTAYYVAIEDDLYKIDSSYNGAFDELVKDVSFTYVVE